MDGGAGEHGDQVVVSHPVPPGWHHWAVTCDAEAGTLRLYLDGQQVSETAAPQPCTYGTSEMYNEIGSIDSGSWGGTWGFYKGGLDQVAVWNVPLSADQIQEVFAQGVKGNEEGLVGLWLFDEEGQTVQDSSSYDCTAPLGKSHEADASDPARLVAQDALEVAVPKPKLEIKGIDPDQYPGEAVFEGWYKHRSRGRDIDDPSELVLKQSDDGSLTAIAHLPFMNATDVASGDAAHRLTRYLSNSEGRGDRPGYSSQLEFEDGKALLTRRGIRDDQDGKELAVPEGAQFDPNSRPDSYCAANILMRGFGLEEGQSKEFTMYDWDNAGEGLAAYTIQLEHKGKEEAVVPAGVFEANHIVLTQQTSADTWFKKRAGHVTDYWMLGNGVIVRIVRHREPYEIELLDYRVPEKLAGHLRRTSE
jgi:hypothetical protein